MQNKNALSTVYKKIHSRIKDQKLIKNKTLREDFSSLSGQNKKGMIIYIKNELEPKLIFADQDGRYIAIEMKLCGKKLCL